MIERLTKDGGFDRRGHEFRYRLASGFIGNGSLVVDAACGTGYGAEFLWRDDTRYLGIDKDLSHLELDDWDPDEMPDFMQADLDTWRPDFPFNVFVCFETLEHVQDPRRLIFMGTEATRWMILSVPIVPTKHVNPYHLHDFKPGWLEETVTHYDGWEHYQTVQQPSEASEIAIFERTRW